MPQLKQARLEGIIAYIKYTKLIIKEPQQPNNPVPTTSGGGAEGSASPGRAVRSSSPGGSDGGRSFPASAGVSGVHSSCVSAGGQAFPAGASNHSYHASAGSDFSPSGSGDTAFGGVAGGSGRTRSGSDGGAVAVRLEATGGETDGETDCTTQVTNTRTRSGEQTNLSQDQHMNRKRK